MKKSFFDRVLNPLGFISEKQFNNKLADAVKSEIDRNLPLWLGETADAARWDMSDPSIFANQADLYRLSPILGTAVDVLSSDIGTSKVSVKRLVGEEVRDIKNHPYELLLRNPNPIDSGLELAQNTVANYLLNGNAIRWLNKADANSAPEEIWPIPFSMIMPIPDKQMYIDHFDYFPGNGKAPMRLETWEIVHYKKYNPNNRFIGLSPLESLAVTITGDTAMRQTNTTTYAKHGGVPPSILTFKEFVNDPAWDDIKKKVKDSAKRDEMMMLRGVGDGVSWLQRAMSNKDADFIAGLKQNMTDVFNRMCPGLLNILSEGATYSNADAARATYSEMTKWPIMEAIAQKDTSDVLPAYGRNLVLVYDDPRYVDKQINLQERGADEKIMTVEELRKEYKQLEPLGDERDTLLISQINAQTGKPTPPPTIVQPGNPNNQPQTNVNVPIDNTPTDNTLPTIKADLMRWKRKAIKKPGQVVDFDSDNIPESMAQEIKTKLAACKTAGEVADIFEQIKPVKVDSIFYLASAIEKAVNGS